MHAEVAPIIAMHKQKISIKWDITNRCNLRCVHCINGDRLGELETELDVEQAKIIIKKLSFLDVGIVQILGGEPFDKEGFSELLVAFEESHIPYGINTNGVFLRKYFDFFKTCKYLKNLFISLDGANKEVNDSIRGKKVFTIVDKNLRDVISIFNDKPVDERTEVNINMVIQQSNYCNVNEMIDYCLALGISHLHLLELILQGNAKHSQQVTQEQMLWVVDVVSKRFDEVKLSGLEIVPKFARPLMRDWLWLTQKKRFPQTFHLCGAGDTFFYIDNQGMLYPCDRYGDVVVGRNILDVRSLLNNEFASVVNRKEFVEAKSLVCSDSYSQLNPCNECHYFKKTCFPCPLVFSNNKPIEFCSHMFQDFSKEIKHIVSESTTYYSRTFELTKCDDIRNTYKIVNSNGDSFIINATTKLIISIIKEHSDIGIKLEQLVDGILNYYKFDRNKYFSILEDIKTIIIDLYIDDIISVEV